ncbi:MAG: ABC transporter permease [Parvibaculaceae bacterium]
MKAVPAVFRRSEAVIALVLLAAMIFIGLVNPAFWQIDNIFNLLRANVVIGIVALGVLLVLVSGGLDVSFPAFAAVAMYLTVTAMVRLGYEGVVLPFLCAMLIGAALGAVNAFFIHKFRMIPLIVTLGTASVARGLLLGAVGTSVINIDRMPPSLIDFARSEVTVSGARLTLMIVLYAALALAVHLLLSRTLLGRSVYAYGGDRESAKRIGFDARITVFFVYCAAGALAGFAGLLHAAMIWQANPRDFIGLELDVIAAVVLGGASIFGGRGSVAGTMLGVFTLVMVNNSLIIMQIDSKWQTAAVGLIIIIATAATAWRDRRREA